MLFPLPCGGGGNNRQYPVSWFYRDFPSGDDSLYAVVIHGGALNGRQQEIAPEGCIAAEAEGLFLSLCQAEVNVKAVIPDVRVIRSRQGGVPGQPFVDDFEAGRYQAIQCQVFIISGYSNVFYSDFQEDVFSLFQVANVLWHSF